MKKITAIMMILLIIAGLKGISQERKPDRVKKKQQFCSVEITMLDKSVEKYALGGFIVDSIIVFPIQMIDKRLEIQAGRETRIAATSIKKIAIRIEKIRNAPSIYPNDSVYKEDLNDSITSTFKKNKTNEVVGSTGNVLLESGGDPLGLAAGILMLPIVIPTSILLSQEKVYHINGKLEKLDRMGKELTGKKSLIRNIL